MTSKNKKLIALFIAGCVCVILVAGAVVFIARGLGNSDKILEGVKIGGLDVGGLTEEEAEQKVESYITKLENRQVTIKIEDNEVVASASELGFSSDAEDSVQKAYQLGKDGSFFSKFQIVSEIDAGEKNFELTNAVDEVILTAYIEEKCTPYNVKMKNSKLKLVNGKFKATKSRDGRTVLVEETAEAVQDALLQKVSDEPLEVAADVEVTAAKYTQKQVKKCQDLLGSYSTSYATSTAARATNVSVAANRINGTIIYPGKTFSVVKTIKDRTVENGYQVAAEYSSGKVVDGVGGGVCQVSTTLYNAVINAELEVVERSPHSMVVSYVDVSRDAAIAGDYKDFKFKNNTDAPVYIAATADGSTLSFRIYGEETRADNRKISFESEILETIQPGEAKEVEDATKPASYRVVTQSAHVGYKARLWKIVTVDGVETERVQLNSSVYAAEPEYITVGKQPEATATPSPSASPEPSGSPEPSSSPEAKATGKPKATSKPKEAAAPKATKEATSKPKTTKAPNATD
jgi:vancomycin resistance protein YoaR